MNNKVNVLGSRIDIMTMQTAVSRVADMLERERMHYIYTPNSEIIMMGYKNKSFADILNSADMLTADGIGVVYASKMLGKPVPERVAGFDLACNIVNYAAKNGKKLFLFGSKPGVAEMAQTTLEESYDGINIAGVRDGYFQLEDTNNIINQINSSDADILFVCLGAPKQEKWIYDNRDKLKVKLCMGLGGGLDVWAGTVKRAPVVYQKLGLEWFYRLMKQPSRIGRMMDLPKFAFTVIAKGKKYEQPEK